MPFLYFLMLLSSIFHQGVQQNCQPPVGFAPPPPPPLAQQIRSAHLQAIQIVEGTVYALPDRSPDSMVYIVVNQYFKGSGPSVLIVANEFDPCAGAALWIQDHAIYFLSGQSFLQRFEATEQVTDTIVNQTGQEPHTLMRIAPWPPPAPMRVIAVVVTRPPSSRYSPVEPAPWPTINTPSVSTRPPRCTTMPVEPLPAT